MTKSATQSAPQIKHEALKKMINRLVKAAPARKDVQPVDPLTRLIRAFLEYDCDFARTEVAERKVQENMVDHNELRVTPAIELAALLGVRYPFAESRCSWLHRTLQSIFDREHHMRLERLKELKKSEVRPYLQSLMGITPYVEAAVCVDCFGIAAAPVDTKLMLWLVSKDALPEGIDTRTAQLAIEKHLKASDAEAFFHGSRKEIDSWSPKSWPQVGKVPSPILAPPTEGGVDRDSDATDTRAEAKAIADQKAAKAAAKDGSKDVKKDGKEHAKDHGKEKEKEKTAKKK
jgi:endonuclease III